MRTLRLTLVSSSPRRNELLAKLNIPFDIVATDVSEQWNFHSPQELAENNARLKVERSSCFEDRSRVLLGADTIVSQKDRILGKPYGELSAKRMLKLLSGHLHEVVTGVCIYGYSSKGHKILISNSVTTQVKFRELTSLQIEEYIDTNEWQGKAGAYAIQGLAGKFVIEINGDYENVIGLPLSLVKTILDEHFSDSNFL